MTNSVAIIGAGASGLIASIVASQKGAKVTLYEKSNKIARKVLASGNGRCNITNRNLSPKNYHTQEPSFVKYALNHFDGHRTKKFFESMGLYLREERDGKLFPQSLQASSVVNFLRLQAQKSGVEIKTEDEVKEIEKVDGGFLVVSTKGRSKYQKVLIATGSTSMSHLGGCDDGLVLAKSLGHTIVDLYSSLVQLVTKEQIFAKANGVKIDADLELFIDGESVQRASGDLLFREYGLSGSAILRISQKASYALLHSKRVVLKADLVPNIELDKLKEMLIKSSKTGGKPKEWLNGIFHRKLIDPLLSYANIKDKLNRKEINRLCFSAKGVEFTIVSTKGKKSAEVMGGGVSCDEIDPKSMESNIVQGLYFSGEVMDVVGDIGGYNLQWAWSSGYLVGEELAKIS